MQETWAVVTGASSGIGKEMARELARRNINLILVARRVDLLQQLASELKVKTECIQADLSDAKACEQLFETATKDRQVQILINNAGIGDYGNFTKTPLEKHIRMIDLNVRSVTILSHLFATHMLGHKHRSYILNVASIAAFQTVPKFGSYSGSKKYVKDITETMAFELSGTNVSVTCLSPGGTYTEFMDHSGQVMKKGSEPFMMTAPQVASIAIKGMFAGRRQIVPGALNILVTIMSKLMPLSWQLRINAFVFSRVVGEAAN